MLIYILYKSCITIISWYTIASHSISISQFSVLEGINLRLDVNFIIFGLILYFINAYWKIHQELVLRALTRPHFQEALTSTDQYTFLMCCIWHLDVPVIQEKPYHLKKNFLRIQKKAILLSVRLTSWTEYFFVYFLLVLLGQIRKKKGINIFISLKKVFFALIISCYVFLSPFMWVPLSIQNPIPFLSAILFMVTWYFP